MIVLNPMTPREREIMDLWDAGMSAEHIVQHLGRAEYIVRRTISCYHDAGEEAADRNAMSQASDDFLAALRAA